MLLASKAACAGIIFVVLATGSPNHSRRRSLRDPVSAKKCQGLRIQTM